MEYYNSIALLVVLLIIILRLARNSHQSRLPPGPKRWPIIGNIHLLGSKPHCSLANLSKTYGPLMSLRLGSATIVVISSPDVAKEMFLQHDSTFSSRRVPDSFRTLGHDKVSVIWNPVGPRWRNLRKISTIQLFTNQRLYASQGLRKKKVDELVQFAKGRSERGLAIDIGKAVSTTSLNLLSNTFFSMDFSSYDSSVSEEFKDLAWHLLEEGARPNVSDFFPLLRPLDLQGVRRRQIVYFRKMMGFFERIIDERLRDQTGANEDVLGTLLKLVKEDQLTLDDVKNLLLVSFFFFPT